MPPNALLTSIFNGVAVAPSGNIYVTGEISSVVLRIMLVDDMAD